MESSLIIAPVVKRNRVSYVKNVLLNSNKVKNYRQDQTDTNYTIVYYTLREDRREKALELKVALTVEQFDALLREPAYEEAIPMYITSKRKPWKFGLSNTVNRVEYFNVDSFAWGYNNADALSSTIIVDESAFKLVELQTAHTIEMISGRASTSASYSESGI